MILHVPHTESDHPHFSWRCLFRAPTPLTLEAPEHPIASRWRTLPQRISLFALHSQREGITRAPQLHFSYDTMVPGTCFWLVLLPHLYLCPPSLPHDILHRVPCLVKYPQTPKSNPPTPIILFGKKPNNPVLCFVAHLLAVLMDCPVRKQDGNLSGPVGDLFQAS